jgi:hypothetical protein
MPIYIKNLNLTINRDSKSIKSMNLSTIQSFGNKKMLGFLKLKVT